MIGESGTNLSANLQLLMLGYMCGYYTKLSEQKLKDKEEKYRLSVDFPNKGVELIGLSNIFLDKKLQRILPSEKLQEIKKAAVVYKYEQPICRKLLNYNKVLRSIKDNGIKSISRLNCKCQQSKFRYQPVGHIITGNLEIVQNLKLRDIFSKGSKYRLPKKIDWDLVEQATCAAIVKYGNHFHRKYKLEYGTINEYTERFMYIARSRIRCEQQKGATEFYDEVAIDKFNDEIKRLHQNFVVAPADKAANNYVFICKKFYVERICQELGIIIENGEIKVTGNDTYKPVDKGIDELIKEHQELDAKYGWESNEQDKNKKEIPLLFATPKLHKNPYGWRFIVGAKFLTIRSLNLLLHKVLCHFKQHFARYCATIERNSGHKHYWSVANSRQVIEQLERVQGKGRVNEIITCDFSTLFTKLPHHIVKDCIFQLVEMCYKSADKQYVMITDRYCCYTNELSTDGKSISLRKEEVFEVIETVLSETYVQFGRLVFKQICGVPMGGNASPLIADLTLSVMEYRYITKSVRDKRSIPEGERYIDDLAVPNFPQYSWRQLKKYMQQN